MPPICGIVRAVTQPSGNSVLCRITPQDGHFLSDLLMDFTSAKAKEPLPPVLAAGDTVEIHGQRKIVNLTTGAVFEYAGEVSQWWWGLALVVGLLVVGLLVVRAGKWQEDVGITEEPPPLAWTRTLSWTRPAMAGSEVRAVQERLVKRGYLHHGDVDGAFGPTTAAAVKRFQSTQGLPTDGKVGPVTWARLFDDTPPAPTTLGSRHEWK